MLTWPPPNPFVAVPVQVAVMRTAQRHREFVADLARQGAALRKLEMVGIRGAAGTDETGLGADELQVIPVAHSQRLPDRRHRLVGRRPRPLCYCPLRPARARTGRLAQGGGMLPAAATGGTLELSPRGGMASLPMPRFEFARGRSSSSWLSLSANAVSSA